MIARLSRMHRLALAALGLAALGAAACAATGPYPGGMVRAHGAVYRSLTQGYSNAQTRRTLEGARAADALADVI